MNPCRLGMEKQLSRNLSVNVTIKEMLKIDTVLIKRSFEQIHRAYLYKLRTWVNVVLYCLKEGQETKYVNTH